MGQIFAISHIITNFVLMSEPLAERMRPRSFDDYVGRVLLYIVGTARRG